MSSTYDVKIIVYKYLYNTCTDFTFKAYSDGFGILIILWTFSKCTKSVLIFVLRYNVTLFILLIK